MNQTLLTIGLRIIQSSVIICARSSLNFQWTLCVDINIVHHYITSLPILRLRLHLPVARLCPLNSVYKYMWMGCTFRGFKQSICTLSKPNAEVHQQISFPLRQWWCSMYLLETTFRFRKFTSRMISPTWELNSNYLFVTSSFTTVQHIKKMTWLMVLY